MLKRVKSWIGRPKMRRVVVVGFAVSLLGAAMASAEEPSDGDDGVIEPDAVVTEEIVLASPLEFFPDPGAVVFSLPDGDGLFTDCSGAILTVEADGSITADPIECIAAPAVGPNGQVNHGQVVKAYVHALKSSGYEGPRGHLIRNAAKSDFGKGDQQVKPDKPEDGGEAGAGLSEDGKKKSKPGRGRGRR